jgi:hypothetical protein
MPVNKPTVATPGALLLHVPAGVASASVVVAPTHTVNVPVIGAVVAPGFTVKLVELTLKKIWPLPPFTLNLQVELLLGGLGTTTLAVPLLAKVPAR